ncbi:hypothetical protein [Cognatazoarcus halotolerans]|uniref:hypothetical protein n=1 Tax=Cognatazoarcus halotolerans TaxID=2686016 RepID=UPI00190F15D1|nr:hypothetical protein [Cognatazoarcus halotolerans]MCB1900176.1 hypothetical protein [Rhodocyclaceae bacterium]MCP5308632.1 hypothetical protein [Zoogloeaceae bacterium]
MSSILFCMSALVAKDGGLGEPWRNPEFHGAKAVPEIVNAMRTPGFPVFQCLGHAYGLLLAYRLSGAWCKGFASSWSRCYFAGRYNAFQRIKAIKTIRKD